MIHHHVSASSAAIKTNDSLLSADPKLYLNWKSEIKVPETLRSPVVKQDHSTLQGILICSLSSFFAAANVARHSTVV